MRTNWLTVLLWLGVASFAIADEIDEPPVAGLDLFQANCAHCHNRSLPRMPSLAGLRTKDPRDVYTAISAGVMQPYARHLSHDERRAVAEFASGQSLGDFASGAAAIPAAAYCEADANAAITNADSGWNGWGNNLSNTRFQSADRAGLNASEVAKLKLKWAFAVPAVSTMSGHPVIADGKLFFGTFSGLVIALDATSGCALWAFEAAAGVRTALTLGSLPNGDTRLFFGDSSGKVYSVNPQTGIADWTILADSHPHIRITGTPVYHDNRLYIPLSSLEEVAGAMPDYPCCTFRGGVLTVDASSGSEIWKTYTIKDEPAPSGKNALGTPRFAPSGAAVWTAPTLDPDSNTVYVVTGDSYSDPAAPESDAVMALAMDSGEIKWITQTLAGDAYTIACADPSEESMVACPDSNGPDLDFGSSPVLAKRSDGTKILLAGQKSGRLYALAPDSGEILWQTQVGDGGIVGGIEWGFGVDQQRAYVAISGAWEKGPGEAGGISAVNLHDGSIAWAMPPHKNTCGGRERCNTGQLAAVTVLDGVVFSGSLDGHLRAYDTATGAVLWDVDTYGDHPAVNGGSARGGSINGPGPAIANGMVFVNSGYGMWNRWMPGNALLAYSLEGQ